MENTTDKKENLGTVSVEVKNEQEFVLPFRALKDGFIRAMNEAAVTNKEVDQLKKKFELGEAEGYHIKRLGDGVACFRQFFVDGFTDSIMKGKVEGGRFFGNVEIGVIVRSKEELKTKTVETPVIDWKDEPNLAIKVKVR